ncbi:hypothetical protein [Fischerella thermalis]|uniref:hypothetical protein n=2 Tax=Fischerella thermalis TaxID=372787 RepID=UPI0011AF2553|nr:hypothetical protein [Fischerella thermalis]MBF1990026.1 hypothetical protein [Fischerella thermalis M58_A2018_009]MBF2072036.1 hypothetical protein [Fischerella thermalis M48_A2018_028]
MTKKYKFPAIAPFSNWVQLNAARVVPLARGGKTVDSLQWRLCCQDKTYYPLPITDLYKYDKCANGHDISILVVDT